MKRVIRVLLVVLLVGSLAGCGLFQSGGSRKPKYPTPLDDSMKESFTLAEQNYFNGDFGEAGRLYQLYISSYGYNEYTDEARFKLGEISFMNKKYNEALSFYRDAFQDLYNPEIAPKAQFKAALSLYNLKHFDQVLPFLDTMDRRDVSPVLGLRTESLAIRVGKKMGSKREDVIKWYLYLLDDYAVLSPDKYEGKVSEVLATQEEAHGVVVNWVRDANVTLASVDQLPLKTMNKRPSGGYVLYKLAMLNYANGDFDSAKTYMSSFVRGYPKNEFAGSGTALLAELKGKMSGKKFKVGVILPLSGRFALYGNSTLHGIQCAAGLTPPCTSPYTIELIVKDSGGNATVAAQAVEDLAKEGVVGIVGPLLSETAGSAAKRAQEIHMPLISLSQKSGVTDAGEFIFRHALSSRDQVEALVNYSVGQRKFKNFAIIYPNNNYGSSFANTFRQSIEAAGGKVVVQRGYDHNDLRGTKSVREMGSYSSGFAATGAGAVVEGMSQKFEVPSSVQAIFIPDSYKAVRYVVMAVHTDSKNLSPNVVFMGVNRWNNPGLVSHDIGMLEGSVFVDGFYKNSADVTTRHFVQSFMNAFGMEPTILEAQSYDALKILMAGIGGGGTSRAKLAPAIAQIKNLGGVTGTISISGNGETTRKMFILTVKNGAIAELSSSRGLIPTSNYSYSKESPSIQNSNAKYEGTQVPDLTVRTDLPKYEPTDFFDSEME